jgi:hypothetical protein
MGMSFEHQSFLMDVIGAFHADGDKGPWHISYNPHTYPDWPDEWDFGDGPVYFHKDRMMSDQKLLVESDFSHHQRSKV